MTPVVIVSGECTIEPYDEYDGWADYDVYTPVFSHYCHGTATAEHCQHWGFPYEECCYCGLTIND